MTQTTFDFENATREFYREVDANDPNVFHKRFSDTAIFALNDVDPITGPAAIDAFVGTWKGNFRAVIHGLDSVIVDAARKTVGIEITVSYVFPDGNTVKVKGSSFVEYSNDQISSWRVYVDTSRLN